MGTVLGFPGARWGVSGSFTAFHGLASHADLPHMPCVVS